MGVVRGASLQGLPAEGGAVGSGEAAADHRELQAADHEWRGRVQLLCAVSAVLQRVRQKPVPPLPADTKASEGHTAQTCVTARWNADMVGHGKSLNRGTSTSHKKP